MSTSAHRVAIYARVSTLDQNPEVQLDQLRQFVADRQWSLVQEFVDHGVSGATRQRPQLIHLLETVHRHQIDVVLVWKLDRLGRSVPDLFHLIDTFRNSNVEFVSFNDPGFDTTTAGGKFIFTLFAAVAQFERDMISERTRAGIALARRKGKKLGRPKKDLDDRSILRDYNERQFSIRQIARDLKVSPNTISKIIARKGAAPL